MFVAAFCALVLPVSLHAASRHSAARPALPNLVQEPPSELGVLEVAGRWHLGFASTVDNSSRVELRVFGSRPDTRSAAMSAYQLVGGRRVLVGTIAFDTEPTHAHWHLRPFEVYELRRLTQGGLLATVRKAGFCLTDSHGAPAAGKPRYRSFCGFKQPQRLRIYEGISPGWSDVYPPEREGQFVDVTNVAAGRYLIVNRVNTSRKILEARYDDNIAATAIDLAWPGGPTSAPVVTVIGTCKGVGECATLGAR
jgi:Lysyl oxidase